MKRLAAFLMGLFLFLAFCSAAGETADPAAAPEPTYTPEEWLELWYQIGSLLRENGRYPYVVLQKGDTGYEVRFLQTRLTELGYYGKEIVDVFGPGTYTAIRQFEKTNGLAVDGVASVEDQRLLFSSLALPASGVKGGGDTDTSGKNTASPTPAPGNNNNVKPVATLNQNVIDNVLATPTPAPQENNNHLKPAVTIDPGILHNALATPKPTISIQIPLITPPLTKPSWQ